MIDKVPGVRLLLSLLVASALARNLPLGADGEDPGETPAPTVDHDQAPPTGTAAPPPEPGELPALEEVTHWLYLIDVALAGVRALCRQPGPGRVRGTSAVSA
jgi:hypothetical protein